MPYCIKVSDFDPDIHDKVSEQTYTLEECQQNCGQVGGLEHKECGCGKP